MSLSAHRPVYLELKDNYTKRKKFKKKQKNRLRSILILIVIFSFILPNILYSTYDFLFLRRIENSGIKIPTDINYLHKSEFGLTNDYFLNNNQIGELNTKAPIMENLPLSEEMPKLRARLKFLVSQNPSLDPGIFIYDYSTGNYININADKEYPTASIIKLPILLQLFKRVEQGTTNLNDNIALKDYYRSEGSGFLQYRPDGATLTVEELARKMIQESDNSATNMILATVGGVNDINRIMRLWGFSRTHMSNWLPDLDGTNMATPKDLGTMLYNINNDKFISIESRAKILEIMSHVKNRFLIKAGLPDNVQFLHKTGDIGTMLGDAGIVMMPNGQKYIMVVMVKRPWNSYSAKQFIIDSSKITYDSFSRNDL